MSRGKRQGAAPDRTTAVHYLKVVLSPAAREAIKQKKARVALVVDHPSYHARAELAAATLAKLADDVA